MRVRQRGLDARAGFTLGELLMVIAIIMVLMALSASAIIKFFNVGPFQATQTNLNKLKAVLDTQWQAVAEKARRDPINMTVAEIDPKGEIKNPVPAGIADERVKKKYVELRLAQAFPISLVEIFNPPNSKLGAWPAYKSYLTDSTSKGGLGLDATTAAAVSLDRQQAICLQMILERGPSNPGWTPDKMGTSLSTRLTPPGANGVVDAWGQSLLFSRNYKGTGRLGLVSMGANRKAGVQTDVNGTNHTLAVTDPNDAEDNIAVPD